LRSVTTATLAKAMGLIKVPLVIRPANHVTRNSLELIKKSPFKHSISWLINVLGLHIANHVVCQSNDLFQDFKRYGVPVKRLTIIGNPIQMPHEEQLQEWRKTKSIGSPALVSVGRLMPQKGFDILVKAIAKIKTQLPHLHLVIYGEGEDKTLLEGLIKEHQLEQQIQLGGFNNQVTQHIARAYFLVSSSRYEGFVTFTINNINS